MNSILKALPGIEMPIPEISRSLRDMWKAEYQPDTHAPSEFRASQLNLIIHFGSETTEEEAQERFSAAIEFTQKYPGRIIVLAPSVQTHCTQKELSGKLFTQCYIGENQRQMCCCEALLLEYAPKEPHMVFNQVSIWLESDLPVYHWFHRIPVIDVRNKYLAFVKNSKRILFDSSFDSLEFLEIPTPHPWRIRDLADARILPLKQSLGQVLSTIEPDTIVDKLEKVTVSRKSGEQCHTDQLASWIENCLGQIKEATPPVIKTQSSSMDSDIAVEFSYSADKKICWKVGKQGKEATTVSQFGSRVAEHRSAFQQASPDQVLAEAIFFG